MREALFMGKIAAAVMHEAQNILAIIKESAGLMDDFLRMQKGGSFKYHNKFLKMTNQIGEQVQRGMLLAEALNSFSHAPEPRHTPCDLIRAAELIVYLSRRHAKGRKITFMVEAGSEPILVQPNMLLVMELLFAVMETASSCPVETVVKIEVSRKGRDGVFRIRPTGGCNFPDPASSPELTDLSGKLGGKAALGPGDAVLVSFPLI